MSHSSHQAFAISRLTLTDFRNYQSLRLEPQSNMIALVGSNGAGKTNLLEALSLLVPGRGLRGAEFPEIARIGGEGRWAVAAVTSSPEGERQIGTAFMPDPEDGSTTGRSAMIDGLPQRSAGRLGELMRMIWLTPAMDRLFMGSPGDCRRFLDRMVLLFDHEHGTRSNSFEKLMRERNRLLEDANPDKAWLSSLETQMAETGVAIAAARLSAITILGQHAKQDMGPFPWGQVTIEGGVEELVANSPALAAEDRYRTMLATSRNADRIAGRTLQGPHRSDLKVIHGPKSMPAELCSTGEQKALLIGLILAQARATQSLHGAAPILLLDEIAAHLDLARRTSLFSILDGFRSQVFMTGTESSLFDGASPSTVVYQVDNGTIFESR
jgi:DNA replication and repair protein RecF